VLTRFQKSAVKDRKENAKGFCARVLHSYGPVGICPFVSRRDSLVL